MHSRLALIVFLDTTPVDPAYGVRPPVDPGYGVPAPPGVPTHPIYYPPGIWGGANQPFPTPPIYHPGHPDHGKPSHPIAPGGEVPTHPMDPGAVPEPQ